MLTKSKIEQISIVKAIRSHELDMPTDKPPCGVEQCPRCHFLGNDIFRRHEIRKRTYLIVVANYVIAIHSYLSRWRCLKCRKTFTIYPPFALPFKHYVSFVIFDRSRYFLECDDVTYRSGTLNNQRPLFRFSGDESKADDRSLAPSTLHRWGSFLGQMPETLCAAVNLIKQADPSSKIFRQLAGIKIHPRKARSYTRMKILICAAQILLTEEYFVRILKNSIFTNFAIKNAWG